jgi:hypothetical protein
VDLAIFPLLVKNAKKGVTAAEISMCTGAERGLIGDIPLFGYQKLP